jgi:glucose/arabinose dehydrogenase
MRTVRFATSLAAVALVTVGSLVAQPKAQAPIPIKLNLVASGLTSPLWLLTAPDGTNRRFIVDQVGLVRVLTEEGNLLATPFLDVRSKLVTLQTNFDERGLLGLAFHPEYATNGKFYVFYSAPLRPGAPTGFNCTSTISEFRVSADPNVADPTSERILLQIDKPQFNHNGGAIAFGPDNLLYIAVGDGGAGNDQGNGHNPTIGNGQDVTTLLGKILRIDVDGATPYGIPSDNPFVGGKGRDEIYAYGFRNPYRMSFDRDGNHNLFVGDAGQNMWEEVSIVHLGGNYGWRLMEGTHGFDPANPLVSPPRPATGHMGEPLLDPIIEYPNIGGQPNVGLGLVVVGGVVYRGDDVPHLGGRYVFADWSRGFASGDGTLLAAHRSGNPRGDGNWSWRQLYIKNMPNGRIGAFINGFGQDRDGEVYVLTNGNLAPVGTTGKVWKIAGPGGRG